jgi:hypothetical protein
MPSRCFFADNPRLTKISFPSVTSLSELEVEEVPELTAAVLGSLEHASTVNLVDLGSSADGDLTLDFAKLTEVVETLSVSNNPKLVSLSGFDALVTLEDSLTVSGNSSLSECLPLELLERLEAQGFDGTVSIGDNMPDTCN